MGGSSCVPKNELAIQTDGYTDPHLRMLAEKTEDAQTKSEPGGALGRRQRF